MSFSYIDGKRLVVFHQFAKHSGSIFGLELIGKLSARFTRITRGLR